ncbi:hypothetical protein HNQ78_002531 [Phycisphaera mikurensis]|nr:hypothetical protein [Phycisphaera mikurensis]
MPEPGSPTLRLEVSAPGKARSSDGDLHAAARRELGESVKTGPRLSAPDQTGGASETRNRNLKATRCPLQRTPSPTG